MSVVKLNISLKATTAEKLKRRALDLKIPTSRYLAQLIEEDARKAQDEIAAEGYRLLSADTGAFAHDAWPIAAETWPDWSDENAGEGGKAAPR